MYDKNALNKYSIFFFALKINKMKHNHIYTNKHAYNHAHIHAVTNKLNGEALNVVHAIV